MLSRDCDRERRIVTDTRDRIEVCPHEEGCLVSVEQSDTGDIASAVLRPNQALRLAALLSTAATGDPA